MVERAGRVDGKVAIVTGAGSTPGPGIGTGKASAVVLAREGARVLLVDLHPERAEETRKMILDEGGTAEVFAADVTKAAERRGHGGRRGGGVRHASTSSSTTSVWLSWERSWTRPRRHGTGPSTSTCGRPSWRRSTPCR